MSQTVDIKMANSVCENLSGLNLSEDSTTHHDKVIEMMKLEYKNHRQEFIDQILAYEKDSLVSQMEAAKLVGQKMVVHLMDNCVPFQQITMFESQPVPKISKTTEKIGEDFTALLLSKSKLQEIDNTLIDSLRVEIIEKYSQRIEKKYGDKNSPAFEKEFNAYIMTESIPYMEWAASNFM